MAASLSIQVNPALKRGGGARGESWRHSTSTPGAAASAASVALASSSSAESGKPASARFPPAGCRMSGYSSSSEHSSDGFSQGGSLSRTSSSLSALSASSAGMPSPSLSEEEFANEWSQRPRRIALFVEPSPFAYICGYKNRFQNFIRYLREMGDEVLVVTTHEGVPTEFHGAKVIGSWSFPCPLYTILPLSLALSPRIINEVSKFKPDLIHASSPGVMCFGALAIAKLLDKPLVLSYHTHVPVYIPKYTFSFLVEPMWNVIRFLHSAADLTLVTSHALGKELDAFGAAASEKIRVWKKGVDSESFNPRFRCPEMRHRLTDGEVEKPLIIHVGRLGAEKNLDLLKPMMDKLPFARLAIIGDGPFRSELEKILEGTPTVFMGMMQGEDLSRAYASGDVFVTPSESETLGFVVLEAMASGVPVVAARAGGIPDIVSRDGETGFMFEPGNVDDAVSKIQNLFEDKELWKNMADAARADVEKFDWRASTKALRNEQYSSAVRFFWREKVVPLRKWLPWWMKKEEWELHPSEAN